MYDMYVEEKNKPYTNIKTQQINRQRCKYLLVQIFLCAKQRNKNIHGLGKVYRYVALSLYTVDISLQMLQCWWQQFLFGAVRSSMCRHILKTFRHQNKSLHDARYPGTSLPKTHCSEIMADATIYKIPHHLAASSQTWLFFPTTWFIARTITVVRTSTKGDLCKSIHSCKLVC